MKSPNTPGAGRGAVRPGSGGRYNNRTARVGDRIVYDGTPMIVSRVQNSTNALRSVKGYKAGNLVWARAADGTGVTFDASSYDDHTIVAGDEP